MSPIFFDIETTDPIFTDSVILYYIIHFVSPIADKMNEIKDFKILGRIY